MDPIIAKAAVFEGNGSPFQFSESQLVGDDQLDAIVEIEMCTICGSDLHTIAGRRSASGPTVLGHEIIGRVVWLPDRPVTYATADDPDPVQVGDRVTWCLHVACGGCFYCSANLPQKCNQLFKYGHSPVTPEYPCTGGFATHCQLKKGTAFVRLPEELDRTIVSPANCATATVAAAFREAGECQGKHVLIMGAGMLGLTGAAFAHASGAASVLVVDTDEARAQRAKDFGATSICTDLGSANRSIDELTDGRGVDLAFDFAGKPDAVLSTIHFLRIGGRAVLCGSVFPTESISISPEMIVRRMLRISGVHNYAARDLVDAVNFLSTHSSRYPLGALVADTYSLNDLEEAVRVAATGDAVRVGICP